MSGAVDCDGNGLVLPDTDGMMPTPSWSRHRPMWAVGRRATAAAALSAASLAITWSLAAHGLGQGVEPAPAVVLTIDDEPVSATQLSAAVRRVPGARSLTPSTPPEQRLLVEARAVDSLINERLLAAAARREAIIVTPQDIDARIDRLVAAAKKVSLEDFLRTTGDDGDDLRHRVNLDLTIEKLLEPQLAEGALRAEYNARRREFDGSRVRVSHVVLRPEMSLGTGAVADTLSRAESIRREILRGDATFADAARKYSSGPSRHRGGDIGFIGRLDPMTEEFSAAAFALAKGDVSKPFTTPFGIHVATVTEIEPGKLSFEAVRGLVLRQVSVTAFRNLVQGLRSKARVVYSPGVPHFAGGRPGAEVVVLEDADVVEPGATSEPVRP